MVIQIAGSYVKDFIKICQISDENIQNADFMIARVTESELESKLESPELGRSNSNRR